MRLQLSDHWQPSLAELTIREAEGDLLEVEPVDLGPGDPASAVLALERGPQPKTPAALDE